MRPKPYAKPHAKLYARAHVTCLGIRFALCEVLPILALCYAPAALALWALGR